MRALLVAAAAAAPLLAFSPANAQAKTANPTPTTATHPPPNFKLPDVRDFTSQSPVDEDGMVAKKDLAPNAHLGVGLAPMLGRNIHSVMTDHDLVPTNNPGVRLVIKLPR